MVKGAIFDVDGVLLNSMPVWGNLGELYLIGQGIEAEEGLNDKLFTMSFSEGAAYLAEHYDLGKTAQQVVDGLRSQVHDYYAHRVPLKEGVRGYLNELNRRRIPMTIATSGDRKNTEAALRRLRIDSYFGGIFISDEIGRGKNEPDVYYAAALQMDTEPENTWVFEDAYHALNTAKNAGFKTVGVYDAASASHLSQIWNTADIYLPDFTDFTVFWNRAGR